MRVTENIILSEKCLIVGESLIIQLRKCDNDRWPIPPSL